MFLKSMSNLCGKEWMCMFFSMIQRKSFWSFLSSFLYSLFSGFLLGKRHGEDYTAICLCLGSMNRGNIYLASEKINKRTKTVLFTNFCFQFRLIRGRLQTCCRLLMGCDTICVSEHINLIIWAYHFI